jgi:hypothetical protein
MKSSYLVNYWQICAKATPILQYTIPAYQVRAKLNQRKSNNNFLSIKPNTQKNMLENCLIFIKSSF